MQNNDNDNNNNNNNILSIQFKIRAVATSYYKRSFSY